MPLPPNRASDRNLTVNDQAQPFSSLPTFGFGLRPVFPNSAGFGWYPTNQTPPPYNTLPYGQSSSSSISSAVVAPSLSTGPVLPKHDSHGIYALSIESGSLGDQAALPNPSSWTVADVKAWLLRIGAEVNHAKTCFKNQYSL